jgi:hypothetical protein
LFTDTDSLCYHIKTNNFYEDIKKDADKWFDTSNYNKEHPLYNIKNKMVLGKMKDECGGKQILEFVRLRSKLYSYITEDSVEKKCKGIKKCIVKNRVTFEEYKDCLKSGKEIYKTQNTFTNLKHIIYTEKATKKALSANDDKRIIRNDSISTYALEHYKVKEI